MSDESTEDQVDQAIMVIEKRLNAIGNTEPLIARQGDGWAWGDRPTLADCCLVPQVYSARRFNLSLDAFPRLVAIEAAAAVHPAFVAAHPDRQPDAD